MFESFRDPPVDTIVALAAAFRQDNRPAKIDLGIGVYKDSQGTTPVMRAVKQAETRVWETEKSKSYLGLGGDEDFATKLGAVALGNSVEPRRLGSIQTVGGGAAVRLICDMFADGATRTIWIPNPTWINHVPMAKAAGLQVREYRYLDRTTSSVAFDQMMDDLQSAIVGDIVLLHGCCHNPTGADLSADQWGAVTQLIAKRGLLPFVDIAYQGFGDGLETDAAGLRQLVAAVPELVLASSCSKNFGVYRDRVGAATVVARNESEARKAKALLMAKGRINYSFPPNHGAATVNAVLSDAALAQDWKEELEAMRLRMVANRAALAAALRRATNSERFDFVSNHKGMFSLLGLTVPQVDRLRQEFAIFMPPDSRMNVAAVREADVDVISHAIAVVI